MPCPKARGLVEYSELKLLAICRQWFEKKVFHIKSLFSCDFSKDPGQIVEHVNHAQNEALLQLPLTALEVYHARLSHYFLRNPQKGCLNLSLKHFRQSCFRLCRDLEFLIGYFQ